MNEAKTNITEHSPHW